jgi:hypothetical protein
VFCDIVTLGGVFTGIERVTKRKDSADLNIIDLLNSWVEPYIRGQLPEREQRRMRAAFRRRLRLFFPLRSLKWGFKNPRTLLILPFLDELLEDMRFIHVIRDGRDISLGNPFVRNNRYAQAYLSKEESALSPEEQMVLFWGRSNEAASEYGTRVMGGRYLRIRWEDLCRDPLTLTDAVYRFAGCTAGDVAEISRIVRTPASMGRWQTFPESLRGAVEQRGRQWLQQFGYYA